MNKDVIYIDVDDDVTAIIGKIKNAKEKIVALVPPKRVGVLQSAVNLRLLERMAKNAKKQLVLITNNQALVALAANAQIPVAKNLQSKPEVAEIPAIVVDNGDDIIDGAQIPVGDHAKTVKVKDGTRTPSDMRSDAIEGTNLDIDDDTIDVTPLAAPVAARGGTRAAATRGKKSPKLPNFDIFRKKLVLIIAGGAALTALLIWMFVFAPAATVVITASTAPSPVRATVKLGGTEATNYEKGILSSVSQQNKKDETVEFEATGVGKVGDKASGTIEFRNYESPNPITIPAGTKLTTNGRTYVTTQAGTAGGAGFMSEGTSDPVAIQATEVGAEYNVDAGTLFAVEGHNSSGATYFRARAESAIDGGSSKEVKVVSADDIERAKGQLVGASIDEAKADLLKKFTNGEIIVDGSFTVTRGKAVSSPAVDQEVAEGTKPKLTIATTYSVQAVAKTELETYLKASLSAKLDPNQKIYSTGGDTATLSNFQKDDDDSMTASVTATGRIGPNIDEAAIKETVKGKIYGEVQQELQQTDGIKDVDIEFSYFWVRRVPNDVNKIKIEFKVDTANE